MARWESFRTCAGCGYDFATGEGEKGCHEYDCAYLPEELEVFCPQCLFDFYTMEGNPPCADPATCKHGAEARSHVENVHDWRQMVGAVG
jgi:hypothetical protein